MIVQWLRNAFEPKRSNLRKAFRLRLEALEERWNPDETAIFASNPNSFFANAQQQIQEGLAPISGYAWEQWRSIPGQAFLTAKQAQEDFVWELKTRLPQLVEVPAPQLLGSLATMLNMPNMTWYPPTPVNSSASQVYNNLLFSNDSMTLSGTAQGTMGQGGYVSVLVEGQYRASGTQLANGALASDFTISFATGQQVWSVTNVSRYTGSAFIIPSDSLETNFNFSQTASGARSITADLAYSAPNLGANNGAFNLLANSSANNAGIQTANATAQAFIPLRNDQASYARLDLAGSYNRPSFTYQADFNLKVKDYLLSNDELTAGVRVNAGNLGPPTVTANFGYGGGGLFAPTDTITFFVLVESRPGIPQSFNAAATYNLTQPGGSVNVGVQLGNNSGSGLVLTPSASIYYAPTPYFAFTAGIPDVTQPSNLQIFVIQFRW